MASLINAMFPRAQLGLLGRLQYIVNFYLDYKEETRKMDGINNPLYSLGM